MWQYLLHLFMVELALHTIGIYCSAILAFFVAHHHEKASDYPIISKLLHNFYLQHPHLHKYFDPWYDECLLSLLKS